MTFKRPDLLNAALATSGNHFWKPVLLAGAKAHHPEHQANTQSRRTLVGPNTGSSPIRAAPCITTAMKIVLCGDMRPCVHSSRKHALSCCEGYGSQLETCIDDSLLPRWHSLHLHAKQCMCALAYVHLTCVLDFCTVLVQLM